MKRCWFCKQERENISFVEIEKLNNSLKLKEPIVVGICPQCLEIKNRTNFKDRIIKK